MNIQNRAETQKWFDRLLDLLTAVAS
jgi:hypothetical protein